MMNTPLAMITLNSWFRLLEFRSDKEENWSCRACCLALRGERGKWQFGPNAMLGGVLFYFHRYSLDTLVLLKLDRNYKQLDLGLPSKMVWPSTLVWRRYSNSPRGLVLLSFTRLNYQYPNHPLVRCPTIESWISIPLVLFHPSA